MSRRWSVRYSNYAFFTLTFESANIPSAYLWSKTPTLYNRFIQKLRRLHCGPVQAIRCIESHENANPHIHVLARFPVVLTINNEQYFDKKLYAKWKELWPSGHLDATPTHPGQRIPVRYLLKYISKHTTTYKTLWRRYFQCLETTQANMVTTSQSTSTSSTPQHSEPEQQDTTPPSSKELKTLLFCKSFNIKSLSWTRDFFSFPLPSARRPETIPLSTPAFR